MEAPRASLWREQREERVEIVSPPEERGRERGEREGGGREKDRGRAKGGATLSALLALPQPLPEMFPLLPVQPLVPPLASAAAAAASTVTLPLLALLPLAASCENPLGPGSGKNRSREDGSTLLARSTKNPGNSAGDRAWRANVTDSAYAASRGVRSLGHAAERRREKRWRITERRESWRPAVLRRDWADARREARAEDDARRARETWCREREES